MNIRAGLREYILQTHNRKFVEDAMGFRTLTLPSGYASDRRHLRSAYDASRISLFCAHSIYRSVVLRLIVIDITYRMFNIKSGDNIIIRKKSNLD